MPQDCIFVTSPWRTCLIPFATLVSPGISKLFVRWDRVSDDLAAASFVAERRRI